MAGRIVCYLGSLRRMRVAKEEVPISDVRRLVSLCLLQH